MESEFCKLEIFLPESHLEAVQQALWSVDAGHIGRYDCCLSYSPVIGAWRPLAGTAPYLGRMGEVCHAPELKVEVTCRTDRVEETVAAVKRARHQRHPPLPHRTMRRSPYPPSGQTARPPEIRRARCLLMRGRPPGPGPQTGPHLRRAGADRAGRTGW